MRKFAYILVILTLATTCRGQLVQEIVVDGFKSGLMNSVNQADMPIDAFVVMDDFDITERGHLKRRRGFERFAAGDDPINGSRWDIMAYYRSGGKKLFNLRLGDGYFTDDTANANVGLLTLCGWDGPAGSGTPYTCTTYVVAGYLNPKRSADIPANSYSAQMNDRLVIGGTASPGHVYENGSVYPVVVRPPGVAKIAVLNGGGSVNGKVSYKFAYYNIDSALYSSPPDVYVRWYDTTKLSAPSEEVLVHNGKVFIYDFVPSKDTLVDSIMIFRSDDDGRYKPVGMVLNSQDAEFIDTTGSPGDTTTYIWGEDPRYILSDSLYGQKVDTNGGDYLVRYTAPPGGATYISVDSEVAAGFGINSGQGTLNWYDSFGVVGYLFVYVDSNNHKSAPSAMTEFQYRQIWPAAGTDTSVKIVVDSVPKPQDPFHKMTIVLRYFWPAFDALGDVGTWRKWYVIDTLTPTDSAFIDSLPVESLTTARLWCDLWADSATMGKVTTNPTGLLPESTCYIGIGMGDSTLQFRPLDLAIHGDRAFVIGDPDDLNRIYWSDFGDFQTWPSDKYATVGTNFGDWFVRLVPYKKLLMMFRQYSVYALSGFSFFQYSIERIFSGVGLSAPEGLIVSSNDILFLHQTGVYSVANPEYAVSQFIERSIDSIGDSITSAWAAEVDNEYWFSVKQEGVSVRKTYIYSPTPTPHWKVYTKGFEDGVLFDTTQSDINFWSDRWIFLANDSLWARGFVEADTIDGTTILPDTIMAKVRTRYYFNGPEREKVLYVDLRGNGTCDSLTLKFYDKGDSLIGQRTIQPNFGSLLRQRVKVDHIFTEFAFEIQDYGMGDYELEGFVIGYQPWDRGRKRP